MRHAGGPLLFGCANTGKETDLIPFDLLCLAITLENSDLKRALSRLVNSLIFFHSHLVCSIIIFLLGLFVLRSSSFSPQTLSYGSGP